MSKSSLLVALCFASALVSLRASAEPKPTLATPVSRGRMEQIKRQSAGDSREIGTLVTGIQQRNAKAGKPGRGFHHASIVQAKAHMQPMLGLPSELKKILSRGIFATSARGVARMSHGRPEGDPAGGARDQRSPDVRGAAVVLDVNGSPQALTFTNQPAQILPTGTDFLRFFHEMGRPGASKLTLPIRLTRAVGLKKLLKAGMRLVVGAAPIPDLFRSQYWGPPIVVGHDDAGNAYVARPTIIPVARRTGSGALARLFQGVRNSRLFNRNPNYLADQATATLADRGTSFILALQFFQDEGSTPLTNDGDKIWKSPVVPVASLHLSDQITGELARRVEAEASFGPQVIANTVDARAEGVGTFQTHRDIAYRRSAQNRGASTDGTKAVLDAVAATPGK